MLNVLALHNCPFCLLFTLVFAPSVYYLSSFPKVNGLGVILDSALLLKAHINNITRSAYFHLRNVNNLCLTLISNNTAVFIHALVFLTNSSEFSCPCHFQNPVHITYCSCPPGTSLVKYRIEFTILLLTFKSLSNLAPLFFFLSLSDLLHIYTPSLIPLDPTLPSVRLYILPA